MMCSTRRPRTNNASAMSERWHRQGTASVHIKADSFLPGHVYQHLQILLELGCLHIVGKSSKGRVAPGLIR